MADSRASDTILLNRLIELAGRCGYQVVEATSLAENAVASSMLRVRGFTALTSLGVTEWALHLFSRRHRPRSNRPLSNHRRGAVQSSCLGQHDG